VNVEVRKPKACMSFRGNSTMTTDLNALEWLPWKAAATCLDAE
jgi:hypothetical protein